MTALWVAVVAVCLWVAYIIGLVYWDLLTYKGGKNDYRTEQRTINKE